MFYKLGLGELQCAFYETCISLQIGKPLITATLTPRCTQSFSTAPSRRSQPTVSGRPTRSRNWERPRGSTKPPSVSVRS